MTDSQATPPLSPSESSTTRRRVLASVVATGMGVAGATASASAQSKITTTFVIESTSEFEGNYAGQFVVVTSNRKTPESIPDLSNCSGVDWDAEGTRVYESLLVDRLAQDPKGVERRLYSNPEDRELAAGSTFVVSDATNCGDYVALGVEQVGPLSVPEGTQTGETTPQATESGDGSAGGPTPGFTVGGVLAAVTGLAGVGAVHRVFGED